MEKGFRERDPTEEIRDPTESIDPTEYLRPKGDGLAK